MLILRCPYLNTDECRMHNSYLVLLVLGYAGVKNNLFDNLHLVVLK